MKLTSIFFDGYKMLGEFNLIDIKLNYQKNKQSFTCSVNDLPEELKNEFNSWIEKTEQYISERITVGGDD